jgi:hypothetical protein
MGLPGLCYIGNQERLFNNTTSTSGSRSFCSLTIATGSALMWDYGIWFTKSLHASYSMLIHVSDDFLPLLVSLRDLEIILFFRIRYIHCI